MSVWVVLVSVLVLLAFFVVGGGVFFGVGVA